MSRLEPAEGPRLIGRDPEVARIDAVLAKARSSSAALLLFGNAGLGKSALLNLAAGKATASGFRVLRAAGVEAELELAFAGLHQLLRPAMAELERLPTRQAAALRCAFGLGEERTPDRFLIGLATLTLLAQVADQHPLLLVVDDAHWLDRGSLEALAFAVRRFSAEPIAVVIASRAEDAVRPFGEAPQRIALEPLADEAARQLLAAQGRSMNALLRDRVLADAAGNPLALIELAWALQGEKARAEAAPTDAPVPRTRLEQVFSDRLAGLPESTRRFVTVAASADGTELEPIVAAATALGLGEEAMGPAERAELIAISGDELHFRHPLVRSIAYATAPISERRAAHLSLAEILAADPDRRSWHLASATAEPDESVASGLEATADRFRVRAGFAAAARALERAAELSPDPVQQARRLVLAAEMAFAAGRGSWVEELAVEINALTDDPQLRARAAISLAYVQSLAGRGTRVDVVSTPALEALMTEAPAVGIGMLVVAAGLGFLDGEPELGAAAERLASLLPGAGDEPWRLYVLAASNPARNAREIMPAVRRLVVQPPQDPQLLKLAAHVPWFIDQPMAAEQLEPVAIDDMRTHGEVGALSTFLVTLGFSLAWRGRWLDARALAAEGIRIADETDQIKMVALGRALDGLVAAMQGDSAVTREQTAAAVDASDAGLVVAVATWARGLAKLGAGQLADASDELRKMFTPGDRAAHFEARRWALADLVEAELHSARADGLPSLVAEMEPVAEGGASVRAQLVVRRAKALLAPDDRADGLFKAALEVVGSAEWPFELARTQLSYGTWLRRHRRIVAARPLLQLALETLSRLGAGPWIDHARAELRAAGITLAPRKADAVEQLSPQQRQIAALAARGLTNREIGSKLFLSPRTVGFHLYNIFPKLEVTRRAQLAEVLGAARAESPE